MACVESLVILNPVCAVANVPDDVVLLSQRFPARSSRGPIVDSYIVRAVINSVIRDRIFLDRYRTNHAAEYFPLQSRPPSRPAGRPARIQRDLRKGVSTHRLRLDEKSGTLEWRDRRRFPRHGRAYRLRHRGLISRSERCHPRTPCLHVDGSITSPVWRRPSIGGQRFELGEGTQCPHLAINGYRQQRTRN